MPTPDTRNSPRRHYEIIVRGELGPRFAGLFDGMTVACHDGLTTISGAVIDQSHLHGILNTTFAFGLDLVSLRQIPDR